MLQENLQEFEKLEETAASIPLLKNCEFNIVGIIPRNDGGRFVITLPLHSKIGQLGLSLEIARNILLSVGPELKKYVKFKEKEL